MRYTTVRKCRDDSSKVFPLCQKYMLLPTTIITIIMFKGGRCSSARDSFWAWGLRSVQRQQGVAVHRVIEESYCKHQVAYVRAATAL